MLANPAEAKVVIVMSTKNVTEIDLDRHYCAKSANELRQIVQPLKKYGITYFSYTRLHPNGVDDFLATEPAVQDIFVENKYYQHVFVGNIDSYSSCVLRWDDLANDNKAITGFMRKMAADLDIANGIIVVEPGNECVEFYYFASTRNNYTIHSFFLSHMEVICSFISYFNVVAAHIKKESYNHRVFYPHHGDASILTKGDFEILNKNLSQPQGGLLTMAKLYHLTSREIECVNHLTQGFSCKQIADHLNISPRTAEKHLQSLRLKTQSRNFSQVLARLYRL